MSKKDLNKYLSLAKEAALTAGEYLAHYKRKKILVDFDSGKDIKIAPDKESEEIIINILREKTGFSILTEEKGFIGSGRKNNNLKWIVDPLDGSFNFFRGIPISCVSIGLWQKEKPMLGVIYDFNRKEMFTGIVGKGAWLNGKKISVSKTNEKDKAVLATGFPAGTDFSKTALKRYIAKVRTFKKIRLLGSAALSLAYVASGRADSYFEKDIMLWDVAAGLAILLGAGGRINLSKTKEKYSYIVAAANSIINEKDLR